MCIFENLLFMDLNIFKFTNDINIHLVYYLFRLEIHNRLILNTLNS